MKKTQNEHESNRIRILMADDHCLIRQGIRSLLEKEEKYEIIGEAADGVEVLRKTALDQPDVLLLDLFMPNLDGFGTLERITKEYPHVRVILLTVNIEQSNIKQAIELGALGYVDKDSNLKDLHSAIDTVMNGEVYLSPTTSKSVVNSYVQQTKTKDTPTSQLTARQIEVLELIAEGHRTKEIADKLCISEKTVEMHRTNLMNRLHIHNIAGLVRYAVRTGVVK